MAIYHANIKSFSRGKGESSMAAAAYRAGIDIVDTRTREIHSYSKRSGVEHYEMLAPVGSEKWCLDPHTFWQANEAEETRANARVARELEVALPAELDPLQRKALALELGQMLVDRYSAVVLVAIHAPSKQGDQRNHHTHLLMSAREVGPDGFGDRAGAEFDAGKGRGANEIRLVRELVAQKINAHLFLAGVEETVDHRSLKAQAQDAERQGDFEKVAQLTREPTQHQGKIRTALAREAAHVATEADDRHRVAAAMDDSMARARERCALISETFGHSHSAALAERARERLGKAVAAEVSTKRRGAGVAGYSPAGLALSSFAGVARRQGKGEEVLRVEAELVDAWLKSQSDASRSILDSLRGLPGWRAEPEFTDAQTALSVPRVHVHGTKPLFFETMEDLTQSILTYGGVVIQPHQRQKWLNKAQEQLSIVLSENDQRSARVRAARQALWKARASVSDRAVRANSRRLTEARTKMVEATGEVCTRFHISRIDAGVPEIHSWQLDQQDDKSRKSDSNQFKLRINRL